MTKDSVIDSIDMRNMAQTSVLSNSAIKRNEWQTNSIVQTVIDNRIKMLYVSAKELSVLNSCKINYDKDVSPRDTELNIEKIVKSYNVVYNKTQIFSAFENVKNLSDMISLATPKLTFAEKMNGLIRKLNLNEVVDSINLIFNNKSSNNLESPNYEFFEQYRKHILDKEFSTKCSFGGLSVHIGNNSYENNKRKYSSVDSDIKDLQKILGILK